MFGAGGTVFLEITKTNVLKLNSDKRDFRVYKHHNISTHNFFVLKDCLEKKKEKKKISY